MLGASSVPEDIVRRRQIEEYFDILKYVKFSRLERIAGEQGAQEAARLFAEKKRETLVGVDPYTYNFSSLYRALPRTERDYFSEFSKADLEERSKILEMVPDNEKSLYVARWRQKDIQDLQKAKQKGLLSGARLEEAEKQIDQFYEDRKTEGFPINDDLEQEYIETRLENESYADWYRRTRIIPKKLNTLPLPGPDFVGWDPRVSLSDLKLKVVESLGENPYDYDIWQEQRIASVRKPYLGPAAEELLEEEALSSAEVKQKLIDVLNDHNLNDARIVLIPQPSGEMRVDLTIQQDRSDDVARIMAYQRER